MCVVRNAKYIDFLWYDADAGGAPRSCALSMFAVLKQMFTRRPREPNKRPYGVCVSYAMCLKLGQNCTICFIDLQRNTYNLLNH